MYVDVRVCAPYVYRLLLEIILYNEMNIFNAKFIVSSRETRVAQISV